jgi:hypothetical protein
MQIGREVRGLYENTIIQQAESYSAPHVSYAHFTPTSYSTNGGKIINPDLVVTFA